MTDVLHGFAVDVAIGAQVGVRLQGNDDSVASGDLTGAAQPLIGGLLGSARVLGRKEHVANTHLRTDGELPGQLVHALGLSQVGLSPHHQRRESMSIQTLPHRRDLTRLGNAQKNVVHADRGQVVPGRVLVLAVARQAAG
ncbi:MAG TPA: hypothetical protein VKA15_08465 [Isosphaeraceae bacterium]|nr:hypothetical protein [Isosphaeraceae bacterium]